MANERKKYTADFKREVVRLMETSGKPAAQLARDLGMNDNNLYRWRGLYGNQQHGNGSLANVTEMEAELKRLRREVEVLRQERDILKKAMSIVSRSQPRATR
jgi:transposase